MSASVAVKMVDWGRAPLRLAVISTPWDWKRSLHGILFAYTVMTAKTGGDFIDLNAVVAAGILAAGVGVSHVPAG